MAQIEFELVSPAKLLVSQPVDMVVVPGTEGDFGALAGHTPMITAIRPGIVEIHSGSKVTSRTFVAGGFAEVVPERVTVLAEEAIPVGDITKEMAELRLKAAKQAVADAKSEREKGEAELLMAIAQAMGAAVAA